MQNFSIFHTHTQTHCRQTSDFCCCCCFCRWAKVQFVVKCCMNFLKAHKFYMHTMCQLGLRGSLKGRKTAWSVKFITDKTCKESVNSGVGRGNSSKGAAGLKFVQIFQSALWTFHVSVLLQAGETAERGVCGVKS